MDFLLAPLLRQFCHPRNLVAKHGNPVSKANVMNCPPVTAFIAGNPVRCALNTRRVA